jgi:site-specific recombinase XerD
MKRETIPGWPGYVHRKRDGAPLFIIEKMVGGRRFHVSTRASNITAATEQLKRFESNPEAYSPSGDIGRPVRLTGQMLTDFRAWQRDVKGVTAKHAFYVAKYLADWGDDIGNRDLRALAPHELREMVGRRTARAHRIAALKVFFAWLRQERGLLRHHQDATLDLKVPQSTPEKHRRRKVLDIAAVEAILPHLKGPSRACVVVLAATGWHVTELDRFARRGELLDDTAGAVAVTPHKSGDLHRTLLKHESHVEAAREVRANGCVPSRLRSEIRDANAAAKLPRERWVTPGVFRHSVATWAVEDGASLEDVARFLGHKDPRTTRRFYVDMRTPSGSIPLRVLQAPSPSKPSRKARISSRTSTKRS